MRDVDSVCLFLNPKSVSLGKGLPSSNPIPMGVMGVRVSILFGMCSTCSTCVLLSDL
jgi:hypothetical protein